MHLKCWSDVERSIEPLEGCSSFLGELHNNWTLTKPYWPDPTFLITKESSLTHCHANCVSECSNSMLWLLLWLLDNAVALKDFTLESILSGVHCFRCHDHTQLVAVTRTLDTFLSQRPAVSCYLFLCQNCMTFCSAVSYITYAFWATVCKSFAYAVGPLSCPSVCLSCHVCNVGVLWPKGWMDEDVTWYGGRPRPRTRPHCVRWGFSSPHRKEHSSPPIFSANFAPAQSPISATAELLCFT